MGKYILPHFDTLDPTSIDDCYEVEIEFNGRTIELDLNFEEESTTAKSLDIVKKFINNLVEYDTYNLKSIKEDFDKGEAVREYFEFHLENFGESHFSSLIDNSNTLTPIMEQLLNKVYLKRVGFYPDNDNQFAVFDYTIGEKLTDYLIVVNLNKDGKVDYICKES